MITTETIHKHGISMFKPILFGLTPAKPPFFCFRRAQKELIFRIPDTVLSDYGEEKI